MRNEGGRICIAVNCNSFRTASRSFRLRYRNRRTDDLSFNNDGIVSASQMSGDENVGSGSIREGHWYEWLNSC